MRRCRMVSMSDCVESPVFASTAGAVDVEEVACEADDVEEVASDDWTTLVAADTAEDEAVAAATMVDD